MRHVECQDFFEFYEKADAKIAVALDEKVKFVPEQYFGKLMILYTFWTGFTQLVLFTM